MSQHLKFGAFVVPLHPPGVNPTLALRQDLEFVAQLDDLGFDEVWFGEHHSAGTELIGCPELFVAAAAERTKNIRLGTGVTSIAYHNPLWVADRMVQLDHMTRGRAILGVGPGSLPTDSAMIGLTPTDTRELLGENLDIIVRLLRGETVSAETRTHKLVNAKLQLRPYSRELETVVAAVASPTGPRLAGTYGLGMLSIGATLTPDGFNALAEHWKVVEERANHYGVKVDRGGWRLCSMFHLAETEEKAREQVRHGIEFWFNYFSKVAAFPQMAMEAGDTIEQMIDYINDYGIGVIGTAEQARAQIQRLIDQSGGAGCIVQQVTNWANRQDTYRSYEIFAREVIPHFQGQAEPTLAAAAYAAEARAGHAAAQLKAVEHMKNKYQAELETKKP